MIINTPTGVIDTSKPAKCSKCRRVFVGEKKPGKLTIAHGKMKFICYQCEPPPRVKPEDKP